jgi:hypothetical protein
MAFIRTYGSSLTTGKPFIAVVADEDDALSYIIVGSSRAKASVESRLARYLEKGLPPDHQTLITTIGGSYVTVLPWESVGDDLEAAVEEAEAVIEAGRPLPGSLVAP